MTKEAAIAVICVVDSPFLPRWRQAGTADAREGTALDSRDLGDAVHFHRKAAGLSRVELADLAGVGKTVIFDIEHGKESVRLNTLEKVLGALNLRLVLEGPLMQEYRKSS